MATEVRDYDALWRVPDVLMDQAHHAHIRPETVTDDLWREQWQIVCHSESDRMLFAAHGFPSVAYAEKHCRHHAIPVQSEEGQ